MAKKKTRGKKDKNETSKVVEKKGLKAETRHGILAVVFFLLALLFFLSAFEMAGVAGKFIYKIFYYLFGVGYALLPVVCVLLGTSFVKSEQPKVGIGRGLSAFVFLTAGLGVIHIALGENAGGVIGGVLAMPFVALFDVYASILLLGALVIISLIVMFDTKPALGRFLRSILNIFSKEKQSEEEEEEFEEGEEDADEEEDTEEENKQIEKNKKETEKKKKEESIGAKETIEEMPIQKRKGVLVSDYVPPPLSLLEEDKGKPNTGDVKANAIIIKRTLANFGIEVEMDEITIGPSVTRYALKPAEGVKLSRIVALQNDLALALAAHPLRIEAPIPGKSLVGIEIPNKAKSIVGLATLLKDEKFAHETRPLTIALGRNVGGKAIVGSLAKMPHCLVAGATGAGKSVTIHAMITSLLYKNGPDDMKFIMVDPKRVELTLYKSIPHLLTPVITDAKKAILALKWAAKEMDRRYDVLEGHTVRDIQSYHANIVAKHKAKEGEEGPERMPYIVIIIDELADIMTAYPRELEAGIVRLAQMSRAVGIHLVLSTQRPEVNVITGLIKANVPARIALKVASQIDSRTILDAGGAEKLLGAGDMLYSSGTAQPERLQSAFITEDEVKKVVTYLRDAYADEIAEEIALSNESLSRDKSIFESSLEDDAGDDDEMYEDARQAVIEAGKASTSFLQRKLRLGYARAARLIDMLEERGVVGPGDGAKPREVLEKIERDAEGNNQV